MSKVNRAALNAQKEVIKNETTPNANTATRIGQMIENQNDSFLTKDDDLVDGLESTDNQKALTASQGKVLKDLVDAMQSNLQAIDLVFESNDIDLNEVQEIVDAIKSLQQSAALLAGKPVDTTGRATGKTVVYDETLDGGNGGYKHVDLPTGGTGGGPAVTETYDDIADRDADVANLVAGQIVKVLDASGDTTVDSGYAYYEYEGSSTFRKLSEEESMDVEAGDSLTASSLGTLINSTDTKPTPIDADLFSIFDSAASFIAKKLTWANIKATLETYFDTLYQAINTSLTTVEYTGSITLQLSDAGKSVDMNSTLANNVTIPPNSSVAFPLGTQIIVDQSGIGQTTIVAGAGVTIQSYGSLVKLSGQYAGASLKKVATNTWRIQGNLSI